MALTYKLEDKLGRVNVLRVNQTLQQGIYQTMYLHIYVAISIYLYIYLYISKYQPLLYSTSLKRPISGTVGCCLQFNHLQEAYALVTNKNTSSQSHIRADSWTEAISEHETDSHLSSIHNLLFCFASNVITQLSHNCMKLDTKPLLQVTFQTLSSIPSLEQGLQKKKSEKLMDPLKSAKNQEEMFGSI